MKLHIALILFTLTLIAFSAGFALAIQRATPGKFIAGVEGNPSSPMTVWILNTKSGKMKTWISTKHGTRARWAFDYETDDMESEPNWWPRLPESFSDHVKEIQREKIDSEISVLYKYLHESKEEDQSTGDSRIKVIH